MDEYFLSEDIDVMQNAASIKKFYKCMLDYDKITKDDFDYLVKDSKQNLEHRMMFFEGFYNFDDDYMYYLDF